MELNVKLPVLKDTEYNIRDYGAVCGGNVSNTKAMNAAIEDAYANGGGKVIVPAGIWLTGPIKLKSGINLCVEKGAYLKFDKNKEEYPLIVTDYEGQPRIRTVSPISAVDCEDIAITGEGVIDGNGEKWRPIKEFKLTARQWEAKIKENNNVVEVGEGRIWLPSQSAYDGYMMGEPDVEDKDALEKAAPYYDYYRPVLVSFIRCSRVLIEGVTIQNSPAWNVHPLLCRDITIRNASIRNPYYAQNGDGLDLESCQNAHIHDVSFDVGDDAICMKSGKNAVGRRIKTPTKNVYIHDCVVYHGHGGFVVGSEMSRGVSDVTVENCTFIGTDCGIRFKSAIGRGGIVENIHISNINMVDISGEAVIFTMGYVLNTMGEDDEEKLLKVAPEDVPEFRNITLDNIVADGAKAAVKIEGLKIMPIHDITIRNSYFKAHSGISQTYAENIILDKVEIVEEE